MDGKPSQILKSLKRCFAAGAILFGCVSIFARADVGFYPLSGFPSAVQTKLEQSVFKIFIPDGTQRVIHVETLDQYDRLIATLDASGNAAVQISIPKLRGCQARKELACSVWDTVNQGTGFLAEFSNRIWTAYHVSRGFVDSSIPFGPHKFEQMQKLQIPVLIVGPTGKTIFGPTEIKMSVVNHTVGEYKPGEGNNDFFDFVAFDLPHPIGTPLEVNTLKLTIGSSVYIPAYPEKTKDRVNFGGPNSDGESMSVAKGKTITVVEAFRRRDLDVNKYANLSQQGYVDQYQILSTADGNDAQSGAPILDQDGKVVGIHVVSLRLGITDPNLTVNQGPSFKFIRIVNP